MLIIVSFDWDFISPAFLGAFVSVLDTCRCLAIGYAWLVMLVVCLHWFVSATTSNMLIIVSFDWDFISPAFLGAFVFVLACQ